MLKDYGIAMVEHDLLKSVTPKIEIAQSFAYLRFHGPEPSYRGSYDDSILDRHAKRIVSWLKDGKEVYVYFNNTMGNALGNLQTLNRMVNSLLY